MPGQARQRQKAQLTEQVADTRRQWLAKLREQEDAKIAYQKETAELITKRGLGIVRFIMWMLAERDQRLDIHIYRIREAEEMREHARVEAESLERQLEELRHQLASLEAANR